ncbi:Amidase domain-containing protein [Psidium guajava]|nr:Amidase domain-containing protein [Psidium guajava]
MASSLCIFALLLLISHRSSASIFLPLTHSISTSCFNTTHHLLKSSSTRSVVHDRATGIEDNTGLSPATTSTTTRSRA